MSTDVNGINKKCEPSSGRGATRSDHQREQSSR